MEEKIIKSAGNAEAGAAAGARVLKQDVYQAGLEARDILESARLKAQQMVQDAESRSDAVFREAWAEGFHQGIAEWDRALQDARDARDALERAYEPQMIQMAVKIAEKIIGHELSSRPDTIVSIAQECLRVVRHEHNLILHINPKEVEEVQRNLHSLTEVAGTSRQIRIVPDAEVAAGGCVIESVEGIVDARLQTQLRHLEDILLRIAARR